MKATAKTIEMPTGQNQVIFVSATRACLEMFWACSPLGLSIQRLGEVKLLDPEDPTAQTVIYQSAISPDNTRGLPEIFNQAIAEAADIAAGANAAGANANAAAANANANANANATSDTSGSSLPSDPNPIVVFVHDDVWIDDAQIGEHLIAGLEAFDVIGIAGSTGRVAGQVAWCFLDSDFSPNIHGASGMVCHGNEPCGSISYYGRSGQSCELLDGVLIAVRLQTLLRSGLRFDPRFEFHFYDMDFCRSARALGLRLGTWPLSITHQGSGEFGGPPWSRSLADYQAKWGD